jgi:hypothetical protein
MGLSRVPKSDKGDISSYQIILDLLVKISYLIEDKNALKKAADAAYSLDAEAEAKAKSAYSDIAKADAEKQEALKQQAIAQEEVAKAEKAKTETSALIDSVNKERKRLQDQDSILGARALDLNNKQIDLSDREKKLALQQNELNKKQDMLFVKQNELNEFDAELKDKAEKLRSIMGV